VADLVREYKKHVCISCLKMVCLQVKGSFVEWRMLILYVENLTFCIIVSWPSQVGLGRVSVLLVIGV